MLSKGNALPGLRRLPQPGKLFFIAGAQSVGERALTDMVMSLAPRYNPPPGRALTARPWAQFWHAMCVR
jgi:hypothetical protein